MTNKTPKLRFPEFSGDWKEKKLGEISIVNMGQSPIGESYNQNRIGIGLINGPAEFTDRYTKVTQYTSEPTKFCELNDIILCVRGSTVGRMNISNGKYCIGRGVASIRNIKSSSDIGFIEQLLNNEIPKLVRIASGSTFPNISKDDIVEREVVVCTLSEQIKIANFLSLVDKKIEKQSEKTEALEEYKKGLMQQIFSQQLRFKDDNGNDYPDWEEKKLGEIVEIYLGLTYTPAYTESGVPFLSVKDITKGKISFDDTKFISKKEYEGATSNAKPKKDDVLFGRVGSIGNPFIVDGNTEFCIFVSLGFLRMKSQGTLNKFIMHWMKTDLFTKQVENKIAGSSQKNLNTGWLKAFDLSIPTLSEQTKIAALLSKMDEKIEKEKEKLEELKTYKKGLLQQMFV